MEPQKRISPTKEGPPLKSVKSYHMHLWDSNLLPPEHGSTKEKHPLHHLSKRLSTNLCSSYSPPNVTHPPCRNKAFLFFVLSKPIGVFLNETPDFRGGNRLGISTTMLSFQTISPNTVPSCRRFSVMSHTPISSVSQLITVPSFEKHRWWQANNP